jgi:ribonuclease HI
MSRKGNALSVRFTTDSRYIVDGMTSWVRGWIGRGWRRREGAVENVALWQAAVAAIAPHETEWVWVKGHAGHPQNEYANHLATRAAAQQDDSGGLVPSGFAAWWEAQAGKATARHPLAPFPEAARVRPAPPLPGAPPLPAAANARPHS